MTTPLAAPDAEADRRFMALALALGRRGQGQCWPNPAVGCVLVRDGRIIARGHTQPGGRPHAEQVALARAGVRARGATAYVSLEPCAHHGATPPCAGALIEAGVARVVAPLADPDPRVSGAGFAMLRAAGVEVTTGVLADQAASDLAGFFSKITQGRPLVTLKLAASFDGRIATASGQSQWITGLRARRLVHHLRARHDAVMVGAGTVRADDPMLTVREMGVSHQPVRVVVSRRLDLPRDGRLAASAHKVPLWLCHGPDADAERCAAWAALGARLLPCAPNGRQLDMRAVLAALAARGLTRVFCEGGAALAAALLAGGLADALVGFTAGLAIGAEGMPMVGALGISALEEAERFRLVEARQVGEDVMHRWQRA